MNHDLTVTGTIDIQAGSEKVWQAMTEPAIIKKYLYGTNTETDWKVGSPITFSGEWQGQSYKDTGVVKSFTPEKELSYSYWSGFSGTENTPENHSLVSYRIEPKAEGITTLYWIQKGYASQEGYEHSKGGMDEFMKSIKQVIENE